MRRGEGEEVEVFAERVREVIATALNIPRTEHTAADVAEYVKRLKATPVQTQRGI